MSVSAFASTRAAETELVTWRLTQSTALEPSGSILPLPPTDYGPRWLLRPEIAALVEDVLFRAQDEWKLLDLDAWVILPNQIHVLYRVQGPSSVARHIIREATGCLALRALGLEGHAVWQASERVAPVEGESDLWRVRQAICRSPVQEGLVTRPEQWFFSSFSRRFEDYSGAA